MFNDRDTVYYRIHPFYFRRIMSQNKKQLFFTFSSYVKNQESFGPLNVSSSHYIPFMDFVSLNGVRPKEHESHVLPCDP